MLPQAAIRSPSPSAQGRPPCCPLPPPLPGRPLLRPRPQKDSALDHRRLPCCELLPPPLPPPPPPPGWPLLRPRPLKDSIFMDANDSRMRSVADPAAACARCAAVLALLRKRDANSCGAPRSQGFKAQRALERRPSVGEHNPYC